MTIHVHVTDRIVVGDGGVREPVFVETYDETEFDIVYNDPIVLSSPYYEYIESRGPPVNVQKEDFATAACGQTAYRRFRVYGGQVA